MRPEEVRGQSPASGASALLRTFIAIPLDDDARQALQTLLASLQAQTPPRLVRWTAPAHIHITLKFLGDTRPDQVTAVTAALNAVAASRPPFRVTLAGRGCFPNFKRPNVIWVGVLDHGQQLRRLAESIERSLVGLGWPAEARPFTPHLTLGRVANHASGAERAELGAIIARQEVGELARLPVAAVHFIRSDLRPTGPIYTTLSISPLAGNPADSDHSTPVRSRECFRI